MREEERPSEVERVGANEKVDDGVEVGERK